MIFSNTFTRVSSRHMDIYDPGSQATKTLSGKRPSTILLKLRVLGITLRIVAALLVQPYLAFESDPSLPKHYYPLFSISFIYGPPNLPSLAPMRFMTHSFIRTPSRVWGRRFVSFLSGLTTSCDLRRRTTMPALTISRTDLPCTAI